MSKTDDEDWCCDDAPTCACGEPSGAVNTNDLYSCFDCGEALKDDGSCKCPKYTAEKAIAARFLGGNFYEIYRKDVFVARFFNGKGMLVDEFLADLNQENK